MGRVSGVDGARFPFPYRTHRLDNGLTVILVPMPGAGLAAYYSIVRTGSRDEVEPGHTGFAHFFEHMMFRGTPTYPGPVYDALVGSLGADANAYTTQDFTVYHLNLAGTDLGRVIELEADRFQNLAYAEREFQTEAGAVYGEYRKGRTDPYWVLAEALQETAFTHHPYGHTTMGFEADISAMPGLYGYSRGFFRRFYRPENLVLLVTGDFAPDATMAEVERRYAGWAAGYDPPEVPTEPPQMEPREATVRYAGRTLPLVAVAWKGPAFDPADREMVAGTMLGELLFGETSTVYRELVLEGRTVQHLDADFGLSRDPGLWGVTAAVSDPGAVAEVQAALEEAAAGLVRCSVGEEALDRLRRRARYRFLMALDTPDHVADEVTPTVALGGGLETVERWLATVAELTPEDVQRVARRYLTAAGRTTVVLRGDEA